ncbi:putative uncharacterized protein SERTAD4-AS1 [Ictidomys tridecemlineatus]|uniref:putative uncharacterized protein SERTAD4-AS1 n=1 Tax=Ictidomys tridecemlineatus TaxID=43179 RepID=UPI00038BC840|nr:putative uncharacterized protein SERTAD4-AS1 [Ictidomys tridecemlineatus]KAG3258168.1 putative uncharacterized protein SERTAD4-AS1 [Ictidomys tridecemlineatus]
MPAQSRRLRERPARWWDPPASTRPALPWTWGPPLPPNICGRSRALGKVAKAEEAGGEKARREAEAWTRRAAASARWGGELRTEEPPPPAARLGCWGGGCGGGGGGGQKVSAPAAIPFSCKRALLTSITPPSPPAKHRGVQLWEHPSC